jgi:hypothetical protein
MTAYIRRGGEKRREQLERAEADMTRALNRPEPTARLQKVAEPHFDGSLLNL